MTFGDIYRDVYSRLALDGDEHDVYFDDISKAINDAIRTHRIEYISQGMGHEFASTETLNSFSKDTQYPFVKSDTLSQKVMNDLPIEMTVLSSTCYNTSNKIYNTTQIYDKGEVARQNNKLYECVESFDGVNTHDRTFHPDDVRNYFPSNNLNYKKDDVIKNTKTGKYYRVKQDFTNTFDEDPDNLTEVEKLYWKEIGSSNIYVAHYAFKFIQSLRVFDSLESTTGIAILDDKLYATEEIEEITLTYIPVWNNIKDMDANLNLPDFMIPIVKNDALMKIGQKLNVKMDLLEQTRPEDDE